MRNILLHPDCFDGIEFWLRNDRRTLLRILELIKDIQRDPFNGKGKPEPLKHELTGLWARRITEEHRLVYSVADEAITVHSCRFHYKK